MYVAIRKHVLPYDETKLSFEVISLNLKPILWLFML